MSGRDAALCVIAVPGAAALTALALASGAALLGVPAAIERRPWLVILLAGGGLTLLGWALALGAWYLSGGVVS